jgi:aspartate aminotransferase
MDMYRIQVSALHKRCTFELYGRLLRLGLDVAAPHGAFYVYPSFQPFAKQLESLGIRTSAQLSSWLITDCGIAALPGSVFGEDDAGPPGGRYRLRMATSYLYFKTTAERYSHGYKLLEAATKEGKVMDLPLLYQAIEALEAAVAKLKTM